MIKRIRKNGRLIFLGFAVLAGRHAWAELQDVTPDEAQALLEQGVPVFDIRTPRE